MIETISSRAAKGVAYAEGSETTPTESAILGIMVFIYILIDPRNNEIRYVGKTKNPLTARLAQHVDDVIYKQEQNWRTHWIAELLRLGYRPRIELIQEVPDAFWRQAEPYWIAYYRAIGCRLTNGTEGGDGGYSPTPDVLAKYGIANMGNTYRLGKSHTEETKAKLSAATKAMWKDPTFRAQVVAGKTGQKHTPETRTQMGESQRKRNEDPAERAKHAGTMKGKPKSPEAIANMAAAQKARRAKEREQKAD